MNRKFLKQDAKQFRQNRKESKLMNRLLNPVYRFQGVTPGMMKRARQHEAYEARRAA